MGKGEWFLLIVLLPIAVAAGVAVLAWALHRRRVGLSAKPRGAGHPPGRESDAVVLEIDLMDTPRPARHGGGSSGTAP
jgi:hypothetical protein